MASEELRRSRLQRAKNFAVRAGSRSRDKISNEELAAIKKKADDLDAIQKSVSEAAAVGAPLWLSYIFLLFYIAIAAGAVTHKELLLESPVDLPFLNIKLPLKAFFILAPILFLIVHAYVLAHFAMLSDKAKTFHDRLTAKINAEVENDHAIREGLRQQLPINVFVQFLAGPTDIRESAFGVMLWVIAWTTLVGAPVLVLLLLQLQFLPYHDTRVTWLHRVILCSDLAVIWWLWMKILDGRDRSKPRHLDRWIRGWDEFLSGFRKYGAPLATAIVATFSLLIATFPGEWTDWPFRLPQELERRIATRTEFVFGKVDALNDDDDKRVTGYWPVNTLRLREFDLHAAIGTERGKPYSFTLKDRRLEHADLRDATLDNIDLRGARLDGALLDRVSMEKANLNLAWLRGASLFMARLPGAWLDEAQLQGAYLGGAELQGALLRGAELLGAKLISANLQGASLFGAKLQAASLNDAQLQAASLCLADLQAASLNNAQLEGGWLDGANLQGADLEDAHLQGASLEAAKLWPIKRIDNIFRLRSGLPVWLPPEPSLFRDLSNRIESLFQADERKPLLERVERLNCKAGGDDLALCKPAASTAIAVVRDQLERAMVDDQAYVNDVVTRLRNLLCEKHTNTIHILRALSSQPSSALSFKILFAPFGGMRLPFSVEASPMRWPPYLYLASSETKDLIDLITTKYDECPVSTMLIPEDRKRLKEIRSEALKFPWSVTGSGTAKASAPRQPVLPAGE